MKRRLLGVIAAAAAIGSVVGLSPPSRAQAAEVVLVCVTVSERNVSINVNGNQLGGPVAGTPRTCVGA